MSSDSPPLKKQAVESAGPSLADQVAKVRHGTPAARKQASRQLASTKHAAIVISIVLPMLSEAGIDASEHHRLVRLLQRIFQRQPVISPEIVPLAQDILTAIQDLLMSPDRSIQDAGRELLGSAARSIGLKAMLTSLRPKFDSPEDSVRQGVAATVASATRAFGLPLMLPLLRAVTNDPKLSTRHLGLSVIQRLPLEVGKSVLPFLPEIVDCTRGPLNEPALSTAANMALTTVAEAVSPFGIEAFEPLMDMLWTGVRGRRGRAASAFLRTLSAFVPLMDPSTAPELAEPLLRIAIRDYAAGDIEIRRTSLSVTRRCAQIVDATIVKDMLPRFFTTFFVPNVAETRGLATHVVRTAAELPVSRSELLTLLVESNALMSDSIEFQRMGLEILSKLDAVPLTLNRRIESRLLDGLMASLPDGDAPKAMLLASVSAVVTVFASLSRDRVAAHSRTWVASLLEREGDPAPDVRAHSVSVLSGIAPMLPRSEVLLIIRYLCEQLGEEYPDVLGSIITALQEAFRALSDDLSGIEPSLSLLLMQLMPILRNRNELVQEATIKTLRHIAEVGGESVPTREWMQTCFELLELQRSPRLTIRKQATAAFASIASVIGPADVASTLLKHLRSPDRQARVTAAAAIASIGAKNGPFTVLPLLMNEYRSSDVVIQHGVLKSLAFLFEFLPAGEAAPYVDALTSLVDDALLNINQVHRQTAASIVYFMAFGCFGQGKEVSFIHFLNELMPSIFETSPHVIGRVLEAIDAIQMVVGVPVFVNYLWAGLFHPARKVRTVYWKIWNAVHSRNSDAMVPTYPISVRDPLDEAVDLRDTWI